MRQFIIILSSIKVAVAHNIIAILSHLSRRAQQQQHRPSGSQDNKTPPLHKFYQAYAIYYYYAWQQRTIY
jgi:hypothetical protein